MGDNRETVAQAVYGKSEDDLEVEEQRELKRLMKGEAPNKAEAAREHDEAVRSDKVATQDAATHQQDNFEAVCGTAWQAAAAASFSHARGTQGATKSLTKAVCVLTITDSTDRQQLSAAGAPELDDMRAAYPTQSAQQVTAPAVSDNKP